MESRIIFAQTYCGFVKFCTMFSAAAAPAFSVILLPGKQKYSRLPQAIPCCRNSTKTKANSSLSGGQCPHPIRDWLAGNRRKAIGRARQRPNVKFQFVGQLKSLPLGDTPGWLLLPYGQFTFRWPTEGRSDEGVREAEVAQNLHCRFATPSSVFNFFEIEATFPQGKALGAPAPLLDKWQFDKGCCRARPMVFHLPPGWSLEFGAGTARPGNGNLYRGVVGHALWPFADCRPISPELSADTVRIGQNV